MDLPHLLRRKKDVQCGPQKKKDNYMVYMRHTSTNYFKKLKIKGWAKIYHSNWNNNKLRTVLVILSKVEFEQQSIQHY